MNRFSAFLIAFGVLLFRAQDRILHSKLWGEDAWIFVPQASDFRYLTESYAGYFHTLPRVIGIILVRLVSFEMLPGAIAVVCIGIFAAVTATLVGKDYEWLVPNVGVRLLVAIGVGFSPGLGESLGNLANLHTFLFFWLALVALRNPVKFSFSWFDLGLSLLVVASEGACILLAPIFFYHFRNVQNSSARKRLGLFLGAVFVIAVLQAAKNVGMAEKHLYSVSEVFHAFFGSIFGMHLIYPLFGQRAFENSLRYPGILIGVGSLLATVLVYRLRKLFSRQHLYLLLSFELTFLAQMLLTWYVRPGSIQYFYSGGEWFWAHRYSFFRPTLGFLMWMFAVQFKGRLGMIVSTALFGVYVVVGSRPFFFFPFP